MNYTQTLAEYAANLRFEDLPGEVVEQAKRLTLHVLGVSLAGFQTRQGRKAIALAKDIGGDKKESTIIGDGRRVSCVQAAFANGTLADVLDWEDCSPTGHPSAGVIPAALAVGERVKASGKEYLVAVVSGYEVYSRIAMAVQPSLEFWVKRGWGLTSWQIFAAAIPAAKLLKLDTDRMAQAIGVASALTPAVNRKITPDSRSDIYHYQHGLTCRDGVMAALMAESGINNLSDMLDGDTGYWMSVSDKCRWEWLARGLGKEYLIMGTLLKRWPANMWVQQYLDIVDAIMREEPIGEIAEIIVSPSMQQKSSRMIYRPDGYLGLVDAQFSIPYCLAVKLLHPKPGPHWFADETLKDVKVLELASKVRAAGLELNPWQMFQMFQDNKYPEARLEIVTHEGRHISRSVGFPKGHPQNRLADDEQRGLFREAASFTLSPTGVEDLMRRILRLEEVDHVSELTEYLSANPENR